MNSTEPSGFRTRVVVCTNNRWCNPNRYVPRRRRTTRSVRVSHGRSRIVCTAHHALVQGRHDEPEFVAWVVCLHTECRGQCLELVAERLPRCRGKHKRLPPWSRLLGVTGLV